MKKIIISIILSILFLGVGNAQEPMDLMEKSIIFLSEGKTDSAIIYCQKVLLIEELENGNKTLWYAYVTNKLNFMYIQDRQIKKAEESCLNNYNLFVNVIGEDNEHFPEAIRLFAFCCRQTENFIALDTLLAKQENLYDGMTVEYAIYLNDLAEYYTSKGKYKEAMPLFLKSEKIYKSTNEKDAYYAVILNNTGQLYYQLSIINKAEEYFIEAKKILTNSSEEYVSYYIATTINLSYVYLSQNRYKEAEELLLINAQLTKGEDVVEYLGIAGGLAQLYYQTNKLEESEKYYKLCRDISEKYFGTSSIYYQSAINGLAVIYSAKKDFKQSKKIYEKNLRLMKEENMDNSIIYSITLSNLTTLYYENGNYKKAKYYSSMLSEKTIQQLQSNFIFLTEKEKFEYTKQNSTNIEALQNLAFDYYKEEPEILGNVFNDLLFYKKLILFNTKSFKQFVENSDNQIIQNTYLQLTEKKREIANSHSQNITPEKLKALQTESENIEKELVRQINQKYPNNNLDFKLHTFKEIQTSLSENEVVVEFTHFQRYKNGKWVDTTYYCALILRKNYDNPKFVYLGTERELQNILKNKNPDKHIASHIKKLYAPSENGLYSFVWQKIEPFLNNIKQVYISPSGLINNVSFVSLEDDNNKKLKDKYNFSYITSSVNVLNNNSLYINDIKNATFIGGVKYNLDSTDVNNIAKEKENFANMRAVFLTNENTIKLTFLPATMTEVDSITKILNFKNKKTNILSGANASEESFYKSTANQIDILHIATHGFYYPTQIADKNEAYNIFNKQVIDNTQFRSGLFLAGAQNSLDNKSSQDIEDGILSSYEISLQDFSKTRLVVLSACQTGLGDIKGNEGVIGLSRAFKIAGAKYIIMSLWEVPSFQTSEFMQLFYTNFAEGENIENAFNKTQNTMSERYSNPYFWAGFILIK